MSRRKRKFKDAHADPPQTFTSILNITCELKNILERNAGFFELQKLGMGMLSGRECIYLMLKDGRRVRVRIEEIKENPNASKTV